MVRRWSGGAAEKQHWPERAVEQLGALRMLLERQALNASEAVLCFDGAPVPLVSRQLELLVETGEAWVDAEGRYSRVEQAV